MDNHGDTRTLNLIIELLASKVPEDGGEQISVSDRLLEDIGIESLELMSLILELEATFDIEFADVDLIEDHFRTVGEVVDIVSRYINTKRTADDLNNS